MKFSRIFQKKGVNAKKGKWSVLFFVYLQHDFANNKKKCERPQFAFLYLRRFFLELVLQFFKFKMTILLYTYALFLTCVGEEIIVFSINF